MSLARAALLAALAAARPAAAQDAPAAALSAETDPDIIEARDLLASSPAAVEAVAARLARSRLIERLTTETDEKARLSAAREWINGDPDAAARVAFGLALDDAARSTGYEDALLAQLAKAYEHNPGAEKNLFGRLSKTAKDSKLIKKQAADVSEDERRETLRAIFEGQDGASNRVIGGQAPDGKAAGGAPAAAAFNGIYDRLSAVNLRGYSPQLVALQSALSARRPPGAPPLLETGKLDYQTLDYPARAMTYDLQNLDRRLKAEADRAFASSAPPPSRGDDDKPSSEARIDALVPRDRTRARLRRRSYLLERATAALAGFSGTALKARDPEAITRRLLVELGAKQKETARWIAAAALEEELSRADELEGFLTPELLAAIAAAPVPAGEREEYRRRGEALTAAVARAKADAEKALGLLESGGWASALAEVARLIAESQRLKGALAREIGDYGRVPFDVAAFLTTQPRWRVWLDDLAIRWAPALPYSRAAAARRARLARALEDFRLIAVTGSIAGTGSEP